MTDVQTRSAENLRSSIRTAAPGISGATRQAALDLVESGARVARETRLPSRKGVVEFFGSQLLGNAVGWTAGVMVAGLVETFFEARSVRNLWGLASWGDRTVVSADDYRLIMALASYTAGLVMLIAMRHLVLRLAAAFCEVRAERNRWQRTADPP